MGHELAINTGAILQSVDQDEDSKQGFRTSYTYIGTRVQCENQRFHERARGSRNLSIKPKGDGNWELISTYPYNAEAGGGNDVDAPVDTHELDVSTVQLDGFVNPIFQAAVSSDNRTKLQDHIERWKRGSAKNGGFDTWTAALASLNAATSSHTATAEYFELMALKKIAEYVTYRCVYSRTLTLATSNQVQASFYGVNKIWTTAQILAWEAVPNSWWFNLADVGTDWIKTMPKVSTNIGLSSKTQIAYQYIASAEATPLYYAPL